MEFEMEKVLLGILGTLCVLLALAVGAMIRLFGKRQMEIREMFTNLQGQLDKFPSVQQNVVQNIIHLGLRNGQLTTDLMPVTLSIDPTKFQINRDLLYKKLIHALDTKKHPNTGTLAYCILDGAGVGELVDSSSFQELQKALTRLLTNEDGGAIRKFLETVAESICQGNAMILNEEILVG
jgi:hypothetical protein